MGNILPKTAIDRLLKLFGNKTGEPNCIIYYSRLCSCVASNNGVYDPTCPACIYGWIYDESQEELVIRTAMNLKAMNEKMVHIYTGGARITIPKYRIDGNPVDAYSRIAQADVIVMKKDEKRDRDICQIGVKDYLISFNITRVLTVSERLKKFTEGEDFEVIYEPMKTQIKWLDGNRPENFYSVEFISLINYMVWDTDMRIRGALDSDLPKQIYCRLRPNFDPVFNQSMEVNTAFKPLHDIIVGTENNN